MTNEQLVEKIQQGEDRNKNLELLFRQNTGFIVKLARLFTGIAETDDLMQEGFIGMMEAAERWSAEKNTPFIRYASYQIRCSMLRFIANSGNTVRVPVNQQGRIRAYKRLIDRFIKTHGREPSKKELHTLLGLSRRQIEKVLQSMNVMSMCSLDSPVAAMEGEDTRLVDTIPDPDDVIEQSEDRIQREQLEQLVWKLTENVLTAREHAVLMKRFKQQKTLHQCAEELGKSPERIRQMEKAALRKLRKSKDASVLREFLVLDDLVEADAYRCTGVGTYQRTRTSTPERVVIKLLDGIERNRAEDGNAIEVKIGS